jgi:methyl-accepting chemotaxis protein
MAGSNRNGVGGEIAAGVKDQATELRAVDAVGDPMNRVTRQNAAMVGESAAASHSPSRDRPELASLVGRRQVGDLKAGNARRRELKKAAPHAFAARSERAALR